MKESINDNLTDKVIIKQRESYIPSQKIDEIKELFLWTELPISDLEKSYKEYADRREGNANRILSGRRLGHIFSGSSYSYYIRYIDARFRDEINTQEKKLVSLHNEIEQNVIPPVPIFKNLIYFHKYIDTLYFYQMIVYAIAFVLFVLSIPLQIIIIPFRYRFFIKNRQNTLTKIEELADKKEVLLNQYMMTKRESEEKIKQLKQKGQLVSLDDYNSAKSPMMRYISDPVLSADFINNFHENKKHIFNGIPNLFTSFFDIDPAYKYIVSKRSLAQVTGYILPIDFRKEYRNTQESKPLIKSYSKVIENITKTFSIYGYKDTKYVVTPLLLYLTDIVFHLKTTKSHDERKEELLKLQSYIRKEELLELQSYIMYSYYDYKQYVVFNKIVDIWVEILSHKRSARGDWWIGNRKLNEEEKQNFLFQFILIVGDLIFQPGLVEDYYNSSKYIVDIKQATDMSEILTKKILPIVDEYFDEISKNLIWI